MNKMFLSMAVLLKMKNEKKQKQIKAKKNKQKKNLNHKFPIKAGSEMSRNVEQKHQATLTVIFKLTFS